MKILVPILLMTRETTQSNALYGNLSLILATFFHFERFDSFQWTLKKCVPFMCVIFEHDGVEEIRRHEINLANALGSKIIDKKSKETDMNGKHYWKLSFFLILLLPAQLNFNMDIENSNFCLKLESNISLWCIEKVFSHTQNVQNWEFLLNCGKKFKICRLGGWFGISDCVFFLCSTKRKKKLPNNSQSFTLTAAAEKCILLMWKVYFFGRGKNLHHFHINYQIICFYQRLLSRLKSHLIMTTIKHLSRYISRDP